MNPLLKAAAQAHGGVTITDDRLTVTVNYPSGGSLTRDWNPLEDNGDAFELLAVVANKASYTTSVFFWGASVSIDFGGRSLINGAPREDDVLAASRRAVTRFAAAQVGYEVAA